MLFFVKPASCCMNLAFGGDNNDFSGSLYFSICVHHEVWRSLQRVISSLFFYRQHHGGIECCFVDSLDGNGSASQQQFVVGGDHITVGVIANDSVNATGDESHLGKIVGGNLKRHVVSLLRSLA